MEISKLNSQWVWYCRGTVGKKSNSWYK